MKKITREQAGAIMQAHKFGTGKLGPQNPDGTYQRLAPEQGGYTYGEIREKYRILTEAGFTQLQAQALMDYGVVGNKLDTDDKNLGGLDLNTAKGDVKLTGSMTQLKLSLADLNINPATFNGFTYSILRLEKLQNEDTGF